MGDVQLVFFAQLSAKLDRLEEVWFIRSGQFVSDVVAKDFPVPVFLRGWLPGDLERVLIHYFHFDSTWSSPRGYITNSIN